MKKKMVFFSAIIIPLILLMNLIIPKNKYSIISDYMINVNSLELKKYRKAFSFNDLNSSKLLDFIDHNAKDLKEDITINKFIENSKRLYLSVGINDLLEYVTLIDNSLIYNPTLINEKMALLEYNINEIISSILAVKNIEIYYFTLYYLNDSLFDEYIKEYNEEIKEVLKPYNINFIETNNLIKIENYTYTIENQKTITEYIKNIK